VCPTDQKEGTVVFDQMRIVWCYFRALTESSALFDRVERGEDGSVVEKVILTAIFAALAIAIGAIIVSKVTAKANSINLN
jgi:hypothetical protein